MDGAVLTALAFLVRNVLRVAEAAITDEQVIGKRVGLLRRQ